MRQLLQEAFTRLEGRSASAPGAFLLSQSMGGGKTHNLLALGLLAKHPHFREPVMRGFYTPGPLGSVRVVAFSGRNTHTPYGLWGEIAGQLNREDAFKDFYSPLKPPGAEDWVRLLSGQATLILLDELPPYFQAAQAVPVGSTTLDHITTTALANLFSAVASGKLENVAVVLTDLGGSAYSEGSQHVSDAIQDLESETDRTVQHIDPVKLNSDELYRILRTRLFEKTASLEEIAAVADAYLQVIDDARKTDRTNASPETIRAQILESYPFHPAIRDLYARFRENPQFQQTRALIRLMRGIVAGLWNDGEARHKYLIGVHDLNLHDSDVLNEIRQINRRFDNAIAHDIASEGQTAVAEAIDRGSASADAQDAAKLIFVSSLSQAVNPTLGLDRGTIVAYLAAPGRDLNGLRAALDDLQAQAWYIHAAPGGQLLFRDVQNLNAMLETFAQGIQPPQRDQDLRDRLQEMFEPKTKAVYQETAFLPALDQVEPHPDRVTLVVFRPGAGAREEIERFWEHQPLKNRLLFLTGSDAAYARVLQRASYLWAVRKILEKLKREGMAESDPTYQEARELESREEAAFYLACRETFQTLLYPHRALTDKELDPRYVANNYEGETQINEALAEVHKYRPDAAVQLDQMRESIERKLWPAEAKVASWSEIRKRAAGDPTWFFTHPRALVDIRDGLVKQDRWRDRGDGFIEHGPFPEVIRGGNTTLDVETLQFQSGQDLLDLVAELKTSLQPDEIEQQA